MGGGDGTCSFNPSLVSQNNSFKGIKKIVTCSGIQPRITISTILRGKFLSTGGRRRRGYRMQREG